MRIYLCVMLCAAVVSCSSSVEKTEPQAGRSTVVLSVELEPPVTVLGRLVMAQQVMLAKVTGDDLKAPSVILSNYQYQGRIYAFNLEPGDYVIVGTWHPGELRGMPSVYRTYFDEATIRSSRFSVPADSITPVGKFSARSMLSGSSDPLSMHYRNITRRQGADFTIYVDYYGVQKSAARDKSDLDSLKASAQMDLQRFPPSWKPFFSN